MFTNPYKKQYDSLMAKLTPPQSGNAVIALNEEWINSAKELARKSSKRSSLLIVMSALTYLTMFMFTDQPYQDNYALMASIILMLVSVFNSEHAAATIYDPLTSGLRKLSNGSNCHKALALIEKFDACREYQTQVLAQGREFIEFDYQLLHAIAERHPNYREELAADGACKKLHGLQEAPAT